MAQERQSQSVYILLLKDSCGINAQRGGRTTCRQESCKAATKRKSTSTWSRQMLILKQNLSELFYRETRSKEKSCCLTKWEGATTHAGVCRILKQPVGHLTEVLKVKLWSLTWDKSRRRREEGEREQCSRTDVEIMRRKWSAWMRKE